MRFLIFNPSVIGTFYTYMEILSYPLQLRERGNRENPAQWAKSSIESTSVRYTAVKIADKENNSQDEQKSYCKIRALLGVAAPDIKSDLD